MNSSGRAVARCLFVPRPTAVCILRPLSPMYLASRAFHTVGVDPSQKDPCVTLLVRAVDRAYPTQDGRTNPTLGLSGARRCRCPSRSYARWSTKPTERSVRSDGSGHGTLRHREIRSRETTPGRVGRREGTSAEGTNRDSCRWNETSESSHGESNAGGAWTPIFARASWGKTEIERDLDTPASKAVRIEAASAVTPPSLLCVCHSFASFHLSRLGGDRLHSCTTRHRHTRADPSSSIPHSIASPPFQQLHLSLFAITSPPAQERISTQLQHQQPA